MSAEFPDRLASSAEPAAQSVILAAGGLVWRPGPDGRLVCVVHRPRYDDWSLPKGKLKRGEHALAGAVREVQEETGVRAVPQLPLAPVRYEVAGVPKRVNYWVMAAATGLDGFQPGSEVDRVAWLAAPAAAEWVRHPHDARLLREWATVPPVTAVVLLVRHADAGARADDGAGQARPEQDRERSLTSQGVADAAALCRLLALFAPERLVSASPRRCRQTLAPLALPIDVDPAFDEETGDPVTASERLRQLAAAGATTVICSQRAMISPVLARLAADPARWHTDKGDGWLLSFAGPRLLAADPLHTQRVRQ